MNPAVFEVIRGERFAFGDNWTRFLRGLNETRIAHAEISLRSMLGKDNLSESSFLDVGCGSGLFSLAARRLGAIVRSFDYDPHSVACTKTLKNRFFPGDANWHIELGSALDSSYLRQLGQFDVVYSWGVLHHTGKMLLAMESVIPLVKPGGQLFIALYNHQGWITSYWTVVKKMFNRNVFFRSGLLVGHLPYLYLGRLVVRQLRRKQLERGMSVWHDMVDWLGGYPFEAISPRDVISFYQQRGFVLSKIVTCGPRHGCNEFVFVRER